MVTPITYSDLADSRKKQKLRKEPKPQITIEQVLLKLREKKHHLSLVRNRDEKYFPKPQSGLASMLGLPTNEITKLTDTFCSGKNENLDELLDCVEEKFPVARLTNVLEDFSRTVDTTGEKFMEFGQNFPMERALSTLESLGRSLSAGGVVDTHAADFVKLLSGQNESGLLHIVAGLEGALKKENAIQEAATNASLSAVGAIVLVMAGVDAIRNTITSRTFCLFGLGAFCLLTARTNLLQRCMSQVLNIFSSCGADGSIQPQVGGKSLYTSLAALMFSFCAVKNSGPVPKAVVKYVEKFDHWRGGLSELFDMTCEIMQRIVDYFTIHVLHCPSFQLFREGDPDIDAFVNDCRVFHEKHETNQMAIDHDTYIELKALVQRGESILIKLPRDSFSRGAVRVLQSYINDTKRLLDLFKNCPYFHDGFRQEPTSLLMIGHPATGKSNTNHYIADALCAATLPRIEIEQYKKTPQYYIYQRQVANEYWDGYRTTHHITVFDDLGQVNDSVGKPNEEFIDLIRALNTNPFPLHMADVDSKGTMYFNSKFVLATTNLRKWKFQSIYDTHAVVRRFDTVVDVIPKAEFSNESGELDYSKLEVDAEGTTILKPECFIYRLCSFDKGTCTFSTRETIPFDDLIRRLLEKHAQKAKWHEQKNRLLAESRAKWSDAIVPQRDPSPDEEPPEPQEFYRHPPIPQVNTANTEYLRELFEGLPGTSAHEIAEHYPPWVDRVYNHLLETAEVSPRSAIMLMQLSEFAPRLFTRHGGLVPVTTRDVLWTLGTRLGDSFRFFFVEGDLQRPLEALLISTTPLCHCTFKATFWQKSSASFLKVFQDLKIAWGMTLTSISGNGFFRDFCNGFLYSIPHVMVGLFTGFTYAAIVRMALVAYDWWSGSGKGKKQKKNKMPELEELQADIVPQLARGVDPNGCDVLAKIRNANCYEFRLPVSDDSAHRLGYITFVRGRVAIMPYHFLVHLKRAVAKEPKAETFEVELVRKDRLGKEETISVPYAQFIHRAKTIPGFQCLDLVAVSLDAAGIRNHSDIVPKFPTAKQLTSKKEVDFQLVFPSVTERELYCGKARYIQESRICGDSQLGFYSLKGVFEYTAPTVTGDCGGLFGILDRASEAKLFGFHVAGAISPRVGYSSPVTQEMLEDVLMKFADEERIIQPLEPLVPQGAIIAVDPPVSCPPGCFEPLAEIRPSVPFGSRSKIMRSKLYGVFGPALKAPARLKPFGEGGMLVDPYIKGISKYGVELPNVNPDLFRSLASCLFNDLKIQAHFEPRPKNFTFEEAVLGDPTYEGFSSIPRETSSGFPYNLKPKHGFRGKEWYFGKDQNYDLTRPQCQELKKEVLRVAEDAALGIRNTHIFTDCLKDELRPLEKVETGDSRLFQACSISLSILNRMYFGAFQSWLYENRVYNGFAIGVNNFGIEWQQIAHRLSTFGSLQANIGAGDLKALDASESTTILWTILQEINAWYGDDPVGNRIRSVLWLELVNSRHVHRTQVIEWCGRMPSGHNLTAIVNSLYVMLTLRYVFYRVCDNGLHMVPKFLMYIYVIVLGDDHVYSVHDEFRDRFTEAVVARYMAEVGLKYTSDTKGPALTVLRKLGDVTFLKRKFLVGHDGQYSSPLDLNVILQKVYWTKDTADAELIVFEKCEDSVVELSLHEKEIFDEYVPRLQSKLQEQYGRSLSITNFEVAFVCARARTQAWFF